MSSFSTDVSKKKTRLSQSERAQFKLSSYLSQVLVGLLLGDLYMRRSSPKANARLVIHYISHIFTTYFERLFDKGLVWK